MGYEQTMVVQNYQTLALVVGQMFGDGKKKQKPPSNVEEAELQLKAVFGG